MSIFLFSLFLSLIPESGATAVLGEVVSDGKRLQADQRGVVILTEEDLGREAGRTVGEILREAAGVDYISGTGGNSNLLIRGSSGSQVLVLIDGVKANDPSATNRYFDWSRIDVTQIERIEILKGPQAVSYGSDAIGGVVLIRTKRGQSGLAASLEAGSEAFVRSRISYGTNLDRVHALRFYLLGKGVFSGKSSALGATPGIPEEGDNSREASVGAELDSLYSASLKSKLQADLRAAKEDIDQGAYGDDPTLFARNREIRTALNLEGIQWKGVASYLNFRRSYLDSIFQGENARAEMQLRSNPSEKSVTEWVGGVEFTRETLGIDSTTFPVVLRTDHAETISAFGEASLPLDSARTFSVDLGSRFSYFTTYETQWSGKVGATAKLSKNLTFDGGISTGFKAPSLYSLYDPTYGNPQLKPEESVQVEFGGVLTLTREMTFSLRGFTNHLRNRFGFEPSPSFRSMNVARAEVTGIESGFDRKWNTFLRSSATLTFLSSHDYRTGQALTDLSKWKQTTKLIFTPQDATTITLSLLGKSARGLATGIGRVPGYGRLDLSLTQQFTPTISASSRIENLLDHDYEEIRGFRTQGLSAYAGIEYRGF